MFFPPRSGEEYLDTVTIGGMAIPEQSIGVAYLAFGFSGVDGILGYLLPRVRDEFLLF